MNERAKVVHEDESEVWLNSREGETKEDEEHDVQFSPDATEAEIFEKLLDDVGSRGYFQNRFNVIFNFALITFFSMPFINYILAMTVPDHWCFVPGREDYNLTLDQWKDIFIPREDGAIGERNAFEKCKMYNLTAEDLKESSQEFIINITKRKEVPVVGCQYGMDYDRTWYRNTAPADANWVCDKELYVTNSFAFGRVGDVLGTLIMGQLGDIIGRKPVFLLSLAVVVIGRSVAVFCIEIFPVFALLSLLANSCANAVFQSPLAIGMEVSSSSLHARINGVQYIGWTLGISVLPFIAWMCGDWRLLILLTTLPSGLFLLLHRIVPESPRWLAAKDRPEEAKKVLKSIAKVNKRELPADCMEKLRHIAEVSRKQKCYGMISLFSSKRLAIHTMLLMVCWIVTSVSYDVIIINVSTLSGNPYLNFFYQSVVELPGYVLGMWITEKLGRRWMHVAFLSLKSIFCFCVTTLMSYYEESWWSIVLVMFAKLCVSLNFYIIYLQSLEVYPTCLRQTGTSAGLIMASIFGVIAPFIVYMGVTIDKRYPYATIAGLGILGAITASFLPETLDQQLPETLEEAKAFGKDQKYWSIVTKFGESAPKTNGRVELEEFPSKRESNRHIIS